MSTGNYCGNCLYLKDGYCHQLLMDRVENDFSCKDFTRDYEIPEKYYSK